MESKRVAALDGDPPVRARERGRLAVGDEAHALSEGGSQYSGRSATRSPSANGVGLSPSTKEPSFESRHEPSGRHEAPLGVPSRKSSPEPREAPHAASTQPQPQPGHNALQEQSQQDVSKGVSELAIDDSSSQTSTPPSRASATSAAVGTARPVRAAGSVSSVSSAASTASTSSSRKAPTASFGVSVPASTSRAPGGTPLNAPKANMAIDAQKVAAVDAADAAGQNLLTAGQSAEAALAAAAAAAAAAAGSDAASGASAKSADAEDGGFRVRERLALQPEPYPQTAPASRETSRAASREATGRDPVDGGAVAGAASPAAVAGTTVAAPPARSASEPEPASEPVADPAVAAAPVARECGYVLGRELGKGTYSTVRECTHKETNKRYAAKIINKRLMRGREFLVRNEIVVLRRVSKNHPSILTLVDYFETASNLYLITELARGGELFDRIYAHGSFYESDAAKVIKEVTSGVAHLHKNGIVHRDLKPENLLYKTSSDHSRLLIADFGLSRIVDEERFRMLTTTCGTPSYMAPEIFSKDGHGKPVDIWAIGVITYFLLCGFVPFDRDNAAEEREAILKGEYQFEPAEYWIHVSKDALSFIKGCLCRRPEDRMTAEQCLQHPFLTKRYRRETDPVPGDARAQSRRSSTMEIPSTLEGEAMNGAYSSSPVVKDRVMGRWG